MLLLITGCGTADVGHDPDLQEVHRLVRAVVELAVGHAAASAHQLHVTGANDRARAQGVLVFQRPFEHIGKDLHVPVWMLAKTLGGGDPVVVDDQQVGEALFVEVAVAGEREGVERGQPAVASNAAVRSFAKGQHDQFS